MPGRDFVVEATSVDGRFALVVHPPRSDWYQPFLPTAPGIVVAVVGLWVAHHFAAQRDKRKEVGDSCEKIKVAIDAVRESASTAWRTTEDLAVRSLDVRSKLQGLGNKATNLKRLSRRTGFLQYRAVTRRRCEIDVVSEVSALRKLITNDPFDDPSRDADEERVAEIAAAASALQSQIDLQYHGLYSLVGGRE